MRANVEDQLQPVVKRNGNPVVKMLVALAILAGLLVLWWYWGSPQEPQETVSAAPPATQPQAVVPAAPDIPQRLEPAPVVVEKGDITVEQAEPVIPVLPTAAESDAMFLQQLNLSGADSLLPGFGSKEHPLDVSTALLNGMGRGVMLRKLLPADAPQQAFTVEEEGESLYMSASSYARYDSYAASIAELDLDAVVSSFHMLRPLYERAFDSLGLDSDDFDNTIIRSLDIILATPEIEEPIELRRDSIMYQYADPELEGLSSVQKQLMRMGPDNIRLIKAQAQALRDDLLVQ